MRPLVLVVLAGCSLVIDPPRYEPCTGEAPRCEGDALVICEGGYLVTRACPLGCDQDRCLPLERLANSTIEGDQDEPSAAAGEDGFLIVFEDDSKSAPDRLGTGIRGRVINGCGIEVGPDFLINEIVVGNQDGPRATAGPGVNGVYFVVWNDESATPPDLDPAVRGRVLRKDGTYAGEDMVIATSTAGAQTTPSVAASPDGFLAVWESEGRVVQGRRFDAAGAPLGPDFAVSDAGSGIEYPAVIWTGDRYLVAWEAREVDKEIRARFVDAAGNLLDDEFRVNASTPGEQLRPGLASGGGMVLALWIDEGPQASGLPSVITGRLIAGSPVGDDLVVAPGASSNQVDPSLVGAADGFTVVWSEEDAAEPGVADVWSRTLDLSGTALSEPMRVHSTLQGDQDDPNVTRGPSGVLASWGDMSMSEPDPFLDSVRYRFFPDEGTLCE